MKLLVLGNSDYNGSMLSDPGIAWPHIVGRRLSQMTGEPVEVVNQNLIPSRANALLLVDGLLESHQPDLVVVGLNPYAFAITRVATRVQQRAGKRVSGWYVR